MKGIAEDCDLLQAILDDDATYLLGTAFFAQRSRKFASIYEW